MKEANFWEVERQKYKYIRASLFALFEERGWEPHVLRERMWGDRYEFVFLVSSFSTTILYEVEDIVRGDVEVYASPHNDESIIITISFIP